MDLSFDQILSLIQGESGAGMVQNLLLAMILLNIRSLRKSLDKLEDNHDKRIENHENRIQVLETRGV